MNRAVLWAWLTGALWMCAGTVYILVVSHRPCPVRPTNAPITATATTPPPAATPDVGSQVRGVSAGLRSVGSGLDEIQALIIERDRRVREIIQSQRAEIAQLKRTCGTK